jgi:hypothetical protein
MREWLALAAAVGLLAVAGCGGMNVNLGGSMGDISAGVNADTSGNVGVNAAAAKTLDTGAGTTTAIGASTSGDSVNVDANVDKSGE